MAKTCILCGRQLEPDAQGATWALCWRCTLRFSEASQETLKELYDRLALRYRETKDKTLFAFMEGFLKPCLQEPIDLKSIRQKHGLTTREIAKRLGISHSMVIQIEKGHRPLPIRLARKLERLKLTA